MQQTRPLMLLGAVQLTAAACSIQKAETCQINAASGRLRPPLSILLRLYQAATRVLAAFARSKRILPPLFLTTAATFQDRRSQDDARASTHVGTRAPP